MAGVNEQVIGETGCWRRYSTRYHARRPGRKSGRIFDEFIAVTGHHRKHGIRLLGRRSAERIRG